MNNDDLLEQYYTLLREAQNISDDLDNYDLDSKDGMSYVGWNLKLAECRRVQFKLINFIIENHKQLFSLILTENYSR